MTLDEISIELVRTDTFLVEPTVEMADEPKLDSAVDPRKAVSFRIAWRRLDGIAVNWVTSSV